MRGKSMPRESSESELRGEKPTLYNIVYITNTNTRARAWKRASRGKSYGAHQMEARRNVQYIPTYKVYEEGERQSDTRGEAKNERARALALYGTSRKINGRNDV